MRVRGDTSYVKLRYPVNVRYNEPAFSGLAVERVPRIPISLVSPRDEARVQSLRCLL